MSHPRPADPPSYPAHGTFAQLLTWHLKWGTRPGCSTENSAENIAWRRSNFAELVHGKGARLESAKRNLQNWANLGRLPDEQDQDRVDGIYRELFNDDPNLQHWRRDLASALENERSEKTGVLSKRYIVEPSLIPQPTPNFMGRADIVQVIVTELIAEKGSFALLVQGGPGIGKTELTKAVAHDAKVSERYGARRWLARLETAVTAEKMIEAIILALGGDPALPLETALDSLSGMQTLLILDNLETPWEPLNQRPATVEALAALRATPGLSLLASIRGRQAIHDVAWTLEHEVKELPRSYATDLFAAIAGPRVRTDHHLDRFLDALAGIPLAISLVARRAHGRASLAPLWREWLKDSQRFVADPDAEAKPQTSLFCSIEMSLNSPRRERRPEALRLFQLLGCSPAGLASRDIDVLLGVDAFVAQECLCHIGIAVEGGDRIDLLPPIRDHATRHYPPHDDDIDRWMHRFLALTTQLGQRIGVAPDQAIILRFRSEFSNIEAAFNAWIKSGVTSEKIAAVHGLGRLCYVAALPTSLFRRLASEYRDENEVSCQADCIYLLGELELRRSNRTAARLDFDQALVLYEMVDNTLGKARCLQGRATLAFHRSEFEEARDQYGDALPLFRAEMENLGTANCLLGLGNAAMALAEFDRAHVDFTEAFALFEQIGYAHGKATCRWSLGRIAAAHYNFLEARMAYHQARFHFS